VLGGRPPGASQDAEAETGEQKWLIRERVGGTTLSYRKRKIVIKHDEEMAREKMKVDLSLCEETEQR
jgi:hypothetical protein